MSKEFKIEKMGDAEDFFEGHLGIYKWVARENKLKKRSMRRRRRQVIKRSFKLPA